MCRRIARPEFTGVGLDALTLVLTLSPAPFVEKGFDSERPAPASPLKWRRLTAGDKLGTNLDMGSHAGPASGCYCHCRIGGLRRRWSWSDRRHRAGGARAAAGSRA